MPNVSILNTPSAQVAAPAPSSASAEHVTVTFRNKAEADRMIACVNACDELVKALTTCRNDCDMALDDTWDRSDDGFIAMRDNIDSVLTRVGGAALRSSSATCSCCGHSDLKAKNAELVEALQIIHDEADHIFGTDSETESAKLDVAIFNAAAIKEIASTVLARLEGGAK